MNIRAGILLAFAVTASSVIAQSWTVLPAATSHGYQDVWFGAQQPDSGVACGYYIGGFDILPFGKRTVDGGNTMQALDLFFGGTFTGAFGLAFTDANTGYICGGGLLKTYDGGANWMQQMDVFTVGGTLYDVHFPSVNNGYAVGEAWTIDGIAVVTHNAGNTWEQFNVSSGVNNENTSLTAVAWVDASHLYAGAAGIVVGSSTLFLSTDDGVTWEPLGFSTGVNGLCATTGDTLFVATDSGIYRITGGSSITSALATSSPVRSVSVRNRVGFAVCADGGIFRSTDGGATWASMPTPVPGTMLNAVRVANDHVVYACGDGGTLLRYEDATMGVGAVAGPAAFVAYPSPSASALTVEYPGTAPGMLEVIDAQGRRVLSQRFVPGRNTLPVGDLAPGVYTLRSIDGPTRSLAFVVAR